MPNPLYLAMTSAEFFACEQKPAHIAWMACHFSPYGTGLSDLPRTLPAQSLLIVNDRIEPHCHDPAQIAQQLLACTRELSCAGVLLDFQRSGDPLTQAVVNAVCDALSCPVAATQAYAMQRPCAVFLPPPPPSVTLSAYFSEWSGRELWLEAAADRETLCLTENGCTTASDTLKEICTPIHRDSTLMCHYRFQTGTDSATFLLYRTADDLHELLRAAEPFGVSCAVGLWQALHASV